jgi:hypothetical protein
MYSFMSSILLILVLGFIESPKIANLLKKAK